MGGDGRGGGGWPKQSALATFIMARTRKSVSVCVCGIKKIMK